MANKVIRLTEQEYTNHIQAIVKSVTAGIDGKSNSHVQDTSFLFYATDNFGRTTFLTIKISNIKNTTNGIAILSGDVVFDGNQMIGDILVDFNKQEVQYIEKRTRHKYNLEIDNRFKSIWNNFLSELKVG